MRLIGFEFCSVLHRRSESDDFITRYIALAHDWCRSRLAPQPKLGLLPFRNGRADSYHPYHYDDARPVLKVNL